MPWWAWAITGVAGGACVMVCVIWYFVSKIDLWSW